MSARVDVLRPTAPKRALIVACNRAVSMMTGWPIGLWWSELTHLYWEFTENGYEVVVASPQRQRACYHYRHRPRVGPTERTRRV
jgi:putative intracellular protease/amidase